MKGWKEIVYKVVRDCRNSYGPHVILELGPVDRSRAAFSSHSSAIFYFQHNKAWPSRSSTERKVFIPKQLNQSYSPDQIILYAKRITSGFSFPLTVGSNSSTVFVLRWSSGTHSTFGDLLLYGPWLSPFIPIQMTRPSQFLNCSSSTNLV